MKRVVLARFYSEAALPHLANDMLAFVPGGMQSRGVTKKPRSPRQKTMDVSRLTEFVAALATTSQAHARIVAGADIKETYGLQPECHHGFRGGAIRWTPTEDDVLRLAVEQNRGSPDKRSKTGIRWAEIQRRAPKEYPDLLRHLTARGCKTLAKRYLQYLSPHEQINKDRVWR